MRVHIYQKHQSYKVYASSLFICIIFQHFRLQSVKIMRWFRVRMTIELVEHAHRADGNVIMFASSSLHRVCISRVNDDGCGRSWEWSSFYASMRRSLLSSSSRHRRLEMTFSKMKSCSSHFLQHSDKMSLIKFLPRAPKMKHRVFIIFQRQPTPRKKRRKVTILLCQPYNILSFSTLP